MTRNPGSWEDDFPIREQFEDFMGRRRAFVIECYGNGLGYTVTAREESPVDEGYLFRVYSETSPYHALGRLREKARLAMATRHLDNARQMLHDHLVGRITSDGEGGTILVVDGLAVSLDELARMLEGLEGWEFELRIKDSLE